MRADQQPSQKGSQGFLDFIYITISFTDIYGEEPSWQKIGELIEPYSLERIVAIVCRINAALHNARVPQNPQIQASICQGLFGEEAETILTAADKLGRKTRDGGNRAIASNHPKEIQRRVVKLGEMG